MNPPPRVSIITPSFNQGRFVEATIRSVLAQTYPHVEYIFADGGSSDETMTIVERYRDRINVVIHEKDRGQSDAINKGFRAATGQLVGWVNSDDVLQPDCVERIVDLFQRNPNGSVYYGATVDWLDEKGRIFNRVNRSIPDKEFLLNQNYTIIQPGSFYPLNLIRKVGGLNEALHYCMDLDLWLRLLDHGPIYAVADEPLAGFRIWGESKTSTGGQQFLRDIRTVLLRHGASPYSPNVRRTYYQAFKSTLKQALLRP